MNSFERIDALPSVSSIKEALEALEPEARKAAILEGLAKSRFQWTWSYMASAFEIPRSEWPKREG